MFKHRLIIC